MPPPFYDGVLFWNPCLVNKEMDGVGADGGVTGTKCLRQLPHSCQLN
jgi:hypothetical protein